MSIGTIVACVVLAAGVAGCATPKGAVPTELMEDCLPTRVLRTETNADLSDSIAELAKTLKLCNLDKKALRQWAIENSL